MSDSNIVSSMKPGGSMSSSGSGSSSESGSGLLPASEYQFEGSESTHECDGSFRCVGSPITRVVKSFASYEKSNTLLGADFNSQSGSGSHSAANKVFLQQPKLLTISQVGSVADSAACKAYRQKLKAEADLEQLKRTMKLWNSQTLSHNYKLHPKCALNNYCRIRCPGDPEFSESGGDEAWAQQPRGQQGGGGEGGGESTGDGISPS
jgi:hypothetical protein